MIDCGVDRNHEDMEDRVLEGFTIRNPAGFGIPQNVNVLNPKAHGMACAGIIAAMNNTIGIRGIAGNSMILPVNIVPDLAVIDPFSLRIIEGFGSNIEIAQAINWTWKRADILSCSWGGGNPSNDIALAIDSARNFGRDGIGSIVVFASGNNHPDATNVAFPGNVDGVITVGAINNRGSIWDYSQRGPSKDLVAPSGGVPGDVVTTDRMDNLGYVAGNYFTQFNGTSAACPQVAGVAALMLSVNPNLTEIQVRETLQNTARDLGSSGFDNVYGYGLVDAYAAVVPRIIGPSLVCDQATYSINNLPSGATVKWSVNRGVFRIIEGQGTSSITVSKFFLRYSRDNVITAEITLPGNTVTISKTGIESGSIEPAILLSPLNGPIPGAHVEYGVTGRKYWLHAYGDGTSLSNNDADYRWKFYSPHPFELPVHGIGRKIEYSQGKPGNYTVTLQYNGECGWTPEIYRTIRFEGPEVIVNLYPNPATDMVTVELREEQPEGNYPMRGTTVLANPGPYEIQLWDMGAMLRRYNTDQPTLQIPVSGLPAGMYFVRVIKDGKTYTKKLIKR